MFDHLWSGRLQQTGVSPDREVETETSCYRSTLDLSCEITINESEYSFDYRSVIQTY